jgi:hypothetical protein
VSREPFKRSRRASRGTSFDGDRVEAQEVRRAERARTRTLVRSRAFAPSRGRTA